MKIALWNNLPSGGGKRAFRAMAAGLIARGHQLESWCPPTACLDYEPLAALMPEHVVDYERLPRRRRQQFLPGLRGLGRHYAELDRHTRVCAAQIDAAGFDVCFVANCGDFAVPPIGRHLRTRAVHYCQELWRGLHEADLQAPKPSPSGLAGGMARLLANYWQSWQCECERADLTAFAHVLVNSHFSRESILRSHGLESQVCYLGIDTRRFRVVARPKGGTVVGLGAVQPHKDPCTAVRAIATLPPAERPELVWIGNMANEDYGEALQRLAGDLGVQLTLRRLIRDDALVAELNRAAVMIYTSRLEPFGFAPLEANACGVPVVAIAEGGVRETVRDGFNGVLVPHRDPAALGAALLGLLRHPERARQLGENGRAWVSEAWTWERCVAQIEALLAGPEIGPPARPAGGNRGGAER